MSKKSKITILSFAILFIFSSMLYITYGYVTAEISGNETSKKITSLSQVLKVEYSGGTNELLSSQDNYFVPGSTLTKTFSIKNVGNQDLNFSINLNNITNDFTRPKDLVYELYLGEQLLITDKFPEEDRAIAYNQSLNIGNTSTYTLKIIYKKSEENQIEDQGKIINASIDFDQHESSLTSLKILGNSIQNGTPTVETPIKIESVGDKSKNILDIYQDRISIKGKIQNDEYKVENGVVSFKTPYYTVSSNIYGIKFEVEPNTDYVLRYTNMTDVRGRSIIYDLDGNELANSNFSGVTFNSGDNKHLLLHMRSTGWNGSVKFKDVMIIKSNESTLYEPYGYKIPIEVKTKNLLKDLPITLGDNTVRKNILKNNIIKLEPGDYTLSFKNIKNATTYRLYAIAYTDSSLTSEITSSSNDYFSISASEPLSLYYSTSVGLFAYGGNKNTTLNNIKIKVTNTCYIGLGVGNGDITTSAKVIEPQLELGDEKTGYEPLFIKANIFLDAPLRKVGSCTDLSCMDYIDFKEQKVVRNIHSENIANVGYKSGDGGTYKKFLSDIEYKPLLNGSGVNAKGYAISNKFVMSNVTYTELSNYSNSIQTYITTGGVNRIAYTFNDDTINTIDLAQTQIGDGFEVNYIMASPIYEDIQTTNFYSINPASNINVSTTVPATVIKESNN